MLCLQLAVKGLDSPASAGPTRQGPTWGKPCNEKMTALALTCISADSERSLHVYLFPSALNSPLTPFKSWFVWVTSANLHRHSGKTSCKAVSFKSAYFHLISHQYEMGSYEKTQFMVHWVGVFKKNTLIRRCTPWIPSNVKQVAGPYNRMLAGPLSQCLYERILTIKQTYIFIHAECLFLAGVPLSHMRIQSCDSHMEWRCSSFLSLWKVGGKEAFSWSESTVNQALHPSQLFCKWIRSSGIILWIPQGQTDTDCCVTSIFSSLCFACECIPLWCSSWSSKSFLIHCGGVFCARNGEILNV